MNSLKYICIDDDPVFINHLLSQLSEFSHLKPLDTFTDSIEALEQINHLKPDVVFIDFEMPAYNGKDLFEMIEYPAQVVFITSHFKPIKTIVNAESKAIIKGYLTKPVALDELKEIIKKLKPIKLDNTEKLLIPSGKTKDYFIDVKELAFIESETKYTNWYFQNKAPLKNIDFQLNKSIDLLNNNQIDFIKANRSKIVFPACIVERNNKDLIIEYFDGKKIIRNEINVSSNSMASSGLKDFFRKLFRR